MRHARLALLPLLLTACTSTPEGTEWRIDEGLAAESLELSVGEDGVTQEIEYHIRPDAVPETVRRAMDELHPGGFASAAEKEYEDGVLYWELTKEIGGYEIEAMFRPDGRLHSEELQIAVTSVPEAVRKTVATGYPKGNVTSWEEIRDGNRRLVEYHVKVADAGKHYKLLVAPDGKLRATYREIPSEIELPLR